MRRVLLAVVPAMLLLTHTARCQSASASRSLTVELIGLSGQRREIGVADLRGRRNVEADVAAHNVRGHYRGVPVGDLLRLVGSPGGDSLRGAALARDVIVEGADGCRVVFAPAELDSGYMDKTVLLAYEKNSAPLDSTEGPFRVIAVGEKRPRDGCVASSESVCARCESAGDAA